MRMLVTGSRNWADPEQVFEDLHFIFWKTPDLQVLTVVHDNCLSGAQRAAKQFIAINAKLCMFTSRDIREEVHEPAYAAFGDRARLEGNSEMLALGINLVLAYPDATSPEVDDCIVKADFRGIPVWNRAAETTQYPV